MASTINATHAAGNTIGYASFLIGSNDIFYLVGTPAFQGASPADQQAMIGATLNIVLTNYQTTLNTLTTLAPEARLLLPGYYNPYPAGTSEHDFDDSVLGVFNPAVQSLAQAYGGRYVDLYSLFAGHELALTNIGTGDVHPNQAGYAVIAGAFSQAVPEPGSLALTGLVVAGLLVRLRRKACRRQPTDSTLAGALAE